MNQILGIGATIAALLGAMVLVGVLGASASSDDSVTFLTLEKLPLGYNHIPDNLAALYNISNVTPNSRLLFRPVHSFDKSPAPGDVDLEWQPSI
jgi:hypothetical protein